MKRREFLVASVATAATLAMPSIIRAAPNKIRLSVATGHAPVVTWVSRLDKFFIPEVNRRLALEGEHEIEWTTAYSGTVAKIGGEIDAVEQQIVDIAIVGAAFNPAKLPLHVVSYFTPFASSGYGTVVNSVDALNDIVPEMANSWKKNRLHYLAGIGIDNFQLFTKKQVHGIGDLAGMKIGGIGPNLNWLKGADVTPVQVAPPAIYNDLETGVYDGVLLPAGLGSNLKVHEPASNLLTVNFGAMSWGALAINNRRMSKLPESVQKILNEVGRDYHFDMEKTQESAKNNGLSKMQEEGLNIVEMTDDARSEWAHSLPHLAKEWAEGLEAKGLPAKEVVRQYIALVQANGGKVIRDWTVGL
ncbi:MAG: C4-dicarboxylate TRAP transporter substrate-binding protein [Hyphomicrobiales bacterium]